MTLTMSYFLQLTAIFILLGWGIYINYRNGQINMSPIYTMAIGAYFSAYATVEWSWPFGLALLVGAGLGAASSFIPALGLGRAPAFATAIATIGLIYITQTVIINMEILGRSHGYYGIPRVDNLLAMTWVILLVVGFLIYRLDHSRLGRAMEMIFVDPDVAATLGVNQYWLSVSLQTAAGALGALAGGLYAFTARAIIPSFFGFTLLLRIICFLFVGGYSTMWGVAVFAPALWALTVFLPGGLKEWINIIYGGLLIIVLLLRPEGVIDKRVTRAIATKSRTWLRQLADIRKEVVTEQRK